MNSGVGRAHRPIFGFVVVWGILAGILLLTASWMPRWGVDVLAGTRVIVTPQDDAVGAAGETRDAALRDTAASLEARARAAGASGAQARVRSDGAIQVAVPGAADDDVLAALSATGEVTVRFVLAGPPLPPDEEPDEATSPPVDPDAATDEELLEEDGAGLPGGIANDPPVEPEIPECPLASGVITSGGLACGPNGYVYVLGPDLLAGTEITRASALVADGRWGVVLDLTDEAQSRVADALSVLAASDEVVAARVAEAQEEASAAADVAGVDAGAADDVDPQEGAEDSEASAVEGPRVPRLALLVDDDVLLIAPTQPADLDEGADGTRLVLFGGLDQPDTETISERVDAGALPVAVASVQGVRLGSTLGPNEGTRGAVAGLVALALALAGTWVLLRRRGVLLVGSSFAAGALAVLALLLADPVVGLPLGLPVVLAALGGLALIPALVWAVMVVTAQERVGRTPRLAAQVAGREVWRRWWPPVFAAALGAAVVRMLFGGELGAVAVTLVCVLGSALITARLVTLPLAVVTASEAPAPGVAEESRSATPRGSKIGLLMSAVLLGIATLGLLVKPLAGDPAFTAGEEHSVTVAGDPAQARDTVRDAVRDVGVTVSSVRASGEETVLITTPQLEPDDRVALTDALAEVPGVRAQVATVGFEAAGSERAWVIGALVLAGALAAGALIGSWARGSSVRRAARTLGVVVASTLGALGAASWVGLTVSPAATAALAALAVVAVCVAVSIDAALPRLVRRGRAPWAAAAVALAPLAAVVVAAPSVRGPFTVALVGVAVAFAATALVPTPVPRPRPTLQEISP